MLVPITVYADEHVCDDGTHYFIVTGGCVDNYNMVHVSPHNKTSLLNQNVTVHISLDQILPDNDGTTSQLYVGIEDYDDNDDLSGYIDIRLFPTTKNFDVVLFLNSTEGFELGQYNVYAEYENEVFGYFDNVRLDIVSEIQSPPSTLEERILQLEVDNYYFRQQLDRSNSFIDNIIQISSYIDKFYFR